MAKKTKRKRLMWGRDFDAWIWEWNNDNWSCEQPVEQQQKKPLEKLGDGKWVRVKFAKVDP